MFRDESKSVVRKAEASAASSASSAPPSSSSSSSSPATTKQNRPPQRVSRDDSLDGKELSELTVSVDPGWFDFTKGPLQDVLMQQLWKLPPEIQPTAELSKQEALCYFLRSNALSATFWVGDVVTRFLERPGGAPSQKAMQAGIVAVASAMLCRVRKMPSLGDVARREYVSALKLLNTALVDAEEAKTNQALGAVVLLAVYEVRRPLVVMTMLQLTLSLGCHVKSPTGYRAVD